MEKINGIKCYAPELAFQNEGFPKDVFEHLLKIEDRNFWFRARNLIIRKLFLKYLGDNTDKKKVLEIGCGNGAVLNSLKEVGYQLVGSEIYLDGLLNTKQRLGESVEFIQMDAQNIPFENEFDAVGAFDVLEHIENDELAMQQVLKSLKKDGLFFITVPQYMFMWSYIDDFAKHKRRYSKKEMIEKLERTGFQIKYTTSFVFILFFFVMFSRFMKKKSSKRIKEITFEDASKEFNIPSWLNFIFFKMMLLEAFLISRGVSLPFGNSLLVVARKF